ncbi:hypothetical protein LPJ58_002167 [Coemansia sp. RSA 1591]|nr:hypothetical protein LPJ58_002167 [Coemansia sp. RSA 1591]
MAKRELEASTSEHQKQRQQMETDVSEWKEECIRTRDDLEQTGVLLTTAREQLAQLTDKHTQLKDTFAAKQLDWERLQQTITDNVRKLELALGEAVARLRQLESQNAAERAVADELRAQQAVMAAKLAEYSKLSETLFTYVFWAGQDPGTGRRLAIRGMDQGQALAGHCAKLVGPQVHTYTRIKYDSCEVLFEDLLTLLCPETARNELFMEIVAKCRYLGFTPSEVLQQVNVDMSFLRQGNTTHQHAGASVVQALTEIFPAEITRPLAEGLSLKETTEALRKAIIKDQCSSTYNS